MKKIERPLLSEIKERIEELEKINLRLVNIEELKDLLKLLFTGYALLTPFIEQDQKLYRGIIYKTKPKHLSLLSYPPKELAKVNRASRDGQSLFYCTTSRQVPFYELDLKPGDRLVISKWMTTRRLLVNNIGYTDSNFKRLNADRESPVWSKDEVNNSEITREENVIVQNFLAKAFSQRVGSTEKDLYKLTIAIAEKHHSEDANSVQFEGLLYPTIPMQGNADNLALLPSAVDSGSIHFKEVEFIEVSRVYDSKFDIEILDWANSISKTGQIEWKGRLPLWDFSEDDDVYFTFEDGQKVLRNKRGEIIEPY